MKYPNINLNIVLVEPEIPNNTGNIGRLCVGSYSKLHIVKPMGFEITDKRLRRAGLDYWPKLELAYYDSFNEFLTKVEDASRMFFFSAKAKISIYDQEIKEGDWLVFGKESVGLDDDLLSRFKNNVRTIPFPGEVRSFNISNAVAMVIGEGLRQIGGNKNPA